MFRSIVVHMISYPETRIRENYKSITALEVLVGAVSMLGTTLLSNTVPVPRTLTSYKLLRGSGPIQKVQLAPLM